MSDNRNRALEKLKMAVQVLSCVCQEDNIAARKQRLRKVRDELSKIASKALQPYCNCQLTTLVTSSNIEEFSAKMAIPCPVHGPCRLGIIFAVGRHLSAGHPSDRRLHELVREYHLRCAAHRLALRNSR